MTVENRNEKTTTNGNETAECTGGELNNRASFRVQLAAEIKTRNETLRPTCSVEHGTTNCQNATRQGEQRDSSHASKHEIAAVELGNNVGLHFVIFTFRLLL